MKEIGHSVALSDRLKVIDALDLTREALIRAVKTEKILRENPGFRPEKFPDNIAALKALKISDTASNYGQYFDETMQISVSIQDELKTLFDK